MTRRIGKLVCAIAVALPLASCSASSTTAPGITQVNPGTVGKLQFAVGTANIYGTLTGLNVVSTFRQANGRSATGVNTPSITGPFVLPARATPAIGGLAVGGSLSDIYTTLWTNTPQQNGGPSLAEVNGATASITGTPQTIQAGTPACDGASPPSGFTQCISGIATNASTFGQSGGVFAMGITPSNTTATTQQSYSYAPYAQPLYGADGVTDTHPQFVPWGGPPAFDPNGNGMGTRDGLGQAGNDSFWPNNVCCNYFLGVGEGFTVFEGVTPSAGSYALNVQIATVGPGGTKNVFTVTANAQLTSIATLGAATAPSVNPDASSGGAAIPNVVLPAGATEALVQIVDYGPGGGPLHAGLVANCQGQRGPSFAPVYYTIHVTQSGPTALGPLNGPNTATGGGIGNLVPSPSICTKDQNQAANAPDPTNPLNFIGDNFTVQLIAVDYPAYAAASSLLHPPVPQTPQIAGPGGQSDITISAPVEEDWQAPGVYGSFPLTHVHRPLGRIHRVHVHATRTHVHVRP